VVSLELTDLDHKSRVGKRVLPEHKSACIADDFTQASQKHACHESPAPPSNTKVAMKYSSYNVEYKKRQVGRTGGLIAIDAPGNWASIKGTIFVSPKDNDAWRKLARHWMMFRIQSPPKVLIVFF
jgi:hypothetical protein